MKKSLIALATLAAAGATFAQSSVTLYGTLDVGYSKTDADGVKFGQNNAAAGSSFHTPSRFGFKGSEDLGGGLKANFNLETGGLDMETGATASNFSRESWVGLSGAFGSTRIGRTSSVATQGQAGFDFNHISTSSAMASLGISPVTWYGSSRRSSQFQYATNNYGGFDAGLGYVTAGDNGDKASTQIRANYASGPLAVGFAAETARANANRTAYAAAGSYDLGVAKLGGGYVQSESEAVGKGWYLNADVPFGAFNAGVQYANNTTTKDKAVELYGRYTLSKRTFVYVDYVTVDKDAANADVKKFGLGVVHNF